MNTGMRWLAGGTFTMGSESFYPEEAPLRQAEAGPFWMDETPVTNAHFATFVQATGYRTLAERQPSAADYPGLLPELAYAGSMVFQPEGGGPAAESTPWWVFLEGGCWHAPLGPGSTLDGLMTHPVVHVAYEDALAYAQWAGKSLPTEVEWEFAARGGLHNCDYAWGDELAPGGAMLANYWQGRFPTHNSALDGWVRTSPVGSFPANGYGLLDMIGNVWEWTADTWTLPRNTQGKKSCCASAPQVPTGAAAEPARHVIKGGSHLCASNHCQRYRPAARHPQAIDTSTSHIGFRCVRR